MGPHVSPSRTAKASTHHLEYADAATPHLKFSTHDFVSVGLTFGFPTGRQRGGCHYCFVSNRYYSMNFMSKYFVTQNLLKVFFPPIIDSYFVSQSTGETPSQPTQKGGWVELNTVPVPTASLRGEPWLKLLPNRSNNNGASEGQTSKCLRPRQMKRRRC